MKGQKVEPGALDNLALLQTLDENSLLEQIRARYHLEIIYTYIGDILLALNPYKRILIYGPEHHDRYTDVKLRADHPPHIFAISDQSYQSMRRTGQSQCCVVSGESGAGKTETTKLMVQHIAHLCKHVNGHLHDRIIQVNPLLEAFGNAQTIMNNNSSRFGKYIELSFAKDGRIMGARISEYLLEKSRVVSQGSSEKNFHVFYYIFAGLTTEQLKINLLNMPEDHRILRSIDGDPIFASQGEFDHYKNQWDRLREIMDTVGFLPEEINMILALLAAILHITDIEFSEDYETDGVYIIREDVMEIAAELLAVQPEELAASFISNVTFLRGERIVSLKTKEQANDGRDALAKALYGRLFGWIVRQINMMLQPDMRSAEVGPSIGILDIAGFENFENNSFEQLCINAANEQLQFYFNQHIFQWELDEYKKEGIKGKDIKFVDNRPVIDLLLRTPIGLFSLMDEESKFPQSNDRSLLEKLDKNFSKRAQFKRPKSQHFKFNINHYAGMVTYNVTGFLEKNRDTLSTNLMECMKNSESQIVCDLFTAPISDTGALQQNPDGPKRSRKSVLLCKAKDWSYTQARSLSKHAGKKLKEQKARSQVPIYENTIRATVGGHFKNSLTDLMGKLLECEPHFVRCIKPNNQKQTSLFDPRLVQEQLKHTGVLETIRIRRLGFATRIPFHVFIDRFKILAFPMSQPIDGTPQNCSKLLKRTGLKDWEIGKTKVFLKYWHTEQLALLMNKVGWDIVHCQRFIRGYLDRKKYRERQQLARHDRDAAFGFCTYIAKMGNEMYNRVDKQKEHDAERLRRKIEEKKFETYARIDQIHQELEQKQVQERERVAQRALSPPRPSVDKGLTPPPRPPRDRSPSPGRPAPFKKFMKPTPILLGNHVYGSQDQVFRDPKEVYGTSSDFRPGVRRPISSESKGKPAEFEESMRAPVSELRNTFEASLNGHLTRQNPIPTLGKNSRAFYDRIIGETIQRLPEIEPDNWAKAYYMERHQVVCKFYLRNSDVIIDNSTENYDGSVMGLGSLDNPDRDHAIEKVRKMIDKGVKLTKDPEGNIFATKLSKGDIIVKGYNDPKHHCMSAEVVDHFGRLTEKPMKIFDMNEYKAKIGQELRNQNIDSAHLHRLSMVSFSFMRNTFDDLDTPCWVIVINLSALNALGQEQQLKLCKAKKDMINQKSRLLMLPNGRHSEVPWYHPHESLTRKVGVLREVQSMARLHLRDAEQQQLRRNWERLDIRNPYGSTPDLIDSGRQSRADSRPTPGGAGQSPYYSSNLYGDHDIYSKGAGAKRRWAKQNVRSQDSD